MSNNAKSDIVFLCQYFYPEFITSAKLPFDIAKYLVEQGYSVGAMCGYPKEYSYHYDCPRHEVVDGVKIKRIKYFHIKRNKIFGRILNVFSFTLFSLFNVRRLKHYKCAVVISDPPILPIVAAVAKRLFKTKMIYISYDVFPEIAIATKNIKKNGFFSRAMNFLQRRFQHSVDAVVALTDEMKEYLSHNRNGVTEDQVVVIPNWSTDTVKRLYCPKCYGEMGYEQDQFIVSYFGNLGICQDIKTLLEAAKELKDNKNIQFLLAGHGQKILPTLKYIDENELENVQLLEFLEGDKYAAALSVSSCFVVSLVKGLKGTCAPSKYYSYLRMGSAVISIGEKDSYLADEVRDENIGVAVECGDVQQLVKSIVYMSEHREETKQMGVRAKELYMREYDKEISLKKYKDCISAVLEKDSQTEDEFVKQAETA